MLHTRIVSLPTQLSGVPQAQLWRFMQRASRLRGDKAGGEYKQRVVILVSELSEQRLRGDCSARVTFACVEACCARRTKATRSYRERNVGCPAILAHAFHLSRFSWNVFDRAMEAWYRLPLQTPNRRVRWQATS